MLTTDVATSGSGDVGSVAAIGTDVVATGGLLSDSRGRVTAAALMRGVLLAATS